MRAVAGEVGRRGGDVEDVVCGMVSVGSVGVVCAVSVMLLVLAMMIVRGCMRVGRALAGRVCGRGRHETGELVT